MPTAAYAQPSELEHDLALVADSLVGTGHKELAAGELRAWRDAVAVFGFRFVCLDVREDSSRLHQTIGEVGPEVGLPADYVDLHEEGKQAVLSAPIDVARAQRLHIDALSPESRETVRLFSLIHVASEKLGPDALGDLIISMTHHASDALAALWLARLGAARYGQAQLSHPHRIVPLFETIDDLNHAGETLTSLLENPTYREHVAITGDKQVCMVGYSDSTKDGGYLAANWHLFDGQSKLAEVADAHRVKLMLFHGRGGALGRGGGPAARGILSLPPSAVRGQLRMTEQGEVLAERYDDPEIAHRHLEQVSWATLLMTAQPAKDVPDAWPQLVADAAARAEAAYREMRADPGFVAYFRQATPIAAIETLPIGSRPSRRKNVQDLSSLRAIPYTFAWTQSRHLITAFYGLGAGLAPLLDEQGDLLRTMYQDWPFFRAMIDNAELALAKADMNIAAAYARLTEDPDVGQRLFTRIRGEYEAATRAVLAIVGQDELLAGTPWLQNSIRVRNPYIDPLNFIQIELIQRLARTDEADPARDTLSDLFRLSVQGVAAGMRTTG